MSTLRDRIRKANVRRITPLEMPEWKDEDGKPITIYLRTLTAGESIELADKGRSLLNGSTREEDVSTDNKKELMAIQLAAFVCDADGTAQFDVATARAELVDAGMREPLQRIVEKALEINGQQSPEQLKGKS